MNNMAHQAVCRNLLGHFNTAGLREWLLQLRRLGYNVEPSTAWGGQGKDALVEAYLRMDGCSAEEVAGKKKRKAKEDKKVNKKLKARRLATAVKDALQVVLDSAAADVSVAQLREKVSTMTGTPLHEGKRLLFFQRQLFKKTRRPKVIRRARQPRFQLAVYKA